MKGTICPQCSKPIPQHDRVRFGHIWFHTFCCPVKSPDTILDESSGAAVSVCDWTDGEGRKLGISFYLFGSDGSIMQNHMQLPIARQFVRLISKRV